MATFLIVFKNLFLFSAIGCAGLSGCLYAVDLFNDLSYRSVDLLVCLDLLCRIDEKYVGSGRLEIVLLLAPAFPDPSLEEIALYSSLEHLLWYGHHHPVVFKAVAIEKYVTKPRHISMTALGK